ncbi:MAG TPA: hypothetical protein VIF61_11475, partial [Methylocystis sp.]
MKNRADRNYRSNFRGESRHFRVCSLTGRAGASFSTAARPNPLSSFAPRLLLTYVFPGRNSREFAMFRSIVERLMRNRRIKRRLPNGVPIYLSPDSQLKYLKSNFDIDLSEMAEKFVTNSSVVWDVGANCGVMAFNAA